MDLRWLAWGGAVWLAAALPCGMSWGAMELVIAVQARAAGPGRAPNPTRAPFYFTGPAERLVYVHPWFAGVIAFWVFAWVFVLGFWVAVALWLLLTEDPGRPTPAGSRPFTLVVVSLTLGLVAAAPWVYGLLVLLTGNQALP